MAHSTLSSLHQYLNQRILLCSSCKKDVLKWGTCAWKSLYFCAKERECKYCIKILYLTSVISVKGRRRKRRLLSWRKQQCLLPKGFYFKDFQKYFICYLQSCILIKTCTEIFIKILHLSLGSLSKAHSELLYQLLWGFMYNKQPRGLILCSTFWKAMTASCASAECKVEM